MPVCPARLPCGSCPWAFRSRRSSAQRRPPRAPVSLGRFWGAAEQGTGVCSALMPWGREWRRGGQRGGTGKAAQGGRPWARGPPWRPGQRGGMGPPWGQPGQVGGQAAVRGRWTRPQGARPGWERCPAAPRRSGRRLGQQHHSSLLFCLPPSRSPHNQGCPPIRAGARGMPLGSGWRPDQHSCAAGTGAGDRGGGGGWARGGRALGGGSLGTMTRGSCGGSASPLPGRDGTRAQPSEATPLGQQPLQERSLWGFP